LRSEGFRKPCKFNHRQVRRIKRPTRALALPVHDSLILPASAEAVGRAGLAEGFLKFAKVVPVIEANHAG